jgi:hypothetical protein
MSGVDQKAATNSINKKQGNVLTNTKKLKQL